jgi:hypothetical protein
MNRLRRKVGKPNGVIPTWALDIPWVDVQAGKDIKRRRRKSIPELKL